MITFENLVLNDDIPIYLQLSQYVKRGIVAEIIEDGDAMPSRRVVSSLLGVNPNTIQKAYRLLEEEGVLLSQPGAKSLISITAEKVRDLRKELLESDVKSTIFGMKSMGIEKEEATILLNDLWDKV